MNRIFRNWQKIRYSLWVIPACIVGIGVALAITAIYIDAHISQDMLGRWPHLFGASSDGARSVLTVVSSAMISVAAVTFSITVLVLASAASQYTSRVIRTFMGNRPTQAVLGVFVAIFIYCLLVLRTIRGGDQDFIPSVSVTFALVLAAVGVGFLVFFIHHVASSIQASAIASAVAADTIGAIESVYPDLLADHPENAACPDEREFPENGWHPVASSRTGYLQTVDVDVLIELAKKHRLVVRMEQAVGAFVSQGLPIAWSNAPADASLKKEINQAYAISHYRTVEQNIGVGIRQLVDMALKALSPAMNDTTTAIMCIDFLSSVLVKLAPRSIVPDLCYSKGVLRVITKGPGFEDFLRRAFEQIRAGAQANAAIYVRLLEALEILGHVTEDAQRKRHIAAQVHYVVDYAKKQAFMPDQLERIERHQISALRALRA